MNVLLSRRVKYTGKIFEPGTILDLPEDKAWRLINHCWAEPIQDHENEGLESSDSSRLFSNGKPTGANLSDPPLIRVYAWCLVNLRFGPILSTPTDFPRAAEECHLPLDDAREAFRKLLKDGDLLCERGRQSGKEIYYLAPIRW